MKLKDKIRILRKARGFSQQDLGDRLSSETFGISRQSISDWENGNSEPKLENIRNLAEVLNVSYNVLLDERISLDDGKVLQDVLNGNFDENEQGNHSPSVTYSFYRDFSWLKFLIIIALLGTLIYFSISLFKELGSIEFKDSGTYSNIFEGIGVVHNENIDTRDVIEDIISIFIKYGFIIIIIVAAIVLVPFIPSKFNVGYLDKSCLYLRNGKIKYIALNSISDISLKRSLGIFFVVIITTHEETIKIHLISHPKNLVRHFLAVKK